MFKITLITQMTIFTRTMNTVVKIFNEIFILFFRVTVSMRRRVDVCFVKGGDHFETMEFKNVIQLLKCRPIKEG